MYLKKASLTAALFFVVISTVTCQGQDPVISSGMEPIVIPTNEFDDDGKIIVPKTEEELKADYKKCNLAMASGPDECVKLPECCYF